MVHTLRGSVTHVDIDNQVHEWGGCDLRPQNADMGATEIMIYIAI
ncbi:hypothetical protein HMPREF1549_00744 [Actinomyces johnsonii F0510]|uniref:Uncharacterized protein n=1 Tax=Actinomyces johnsonii F0510 TaxID=1227262 RepID=U1QGJ8_9ACTO|nr:hypothetical protein HMPREF1549_00744 [Actinomyces johnsonii F0510]